MLRSWSFSQEYTEYVGRRGSMAAVRFFNVDCDALHFHTGWLKINIFKVLLGGREGITKKSTRCTHLIMLTILDDP